MCEFQKGTARDRLELGFVNRNGKCNAFARLAASLVLGSGLSGILLVSWRFVLFRLVSSSVAGQYFEFCCIWLTNESSMNSFVNS